MKGIQKAPSTTTIFMRNRCVFVDTGAFLALANEADQCHERAKVCFQELQATKTPFLTSNFVLDETYTRIRGKAGLRTAVVFGEKIQSSSQLKIVTIERSLEKKAWEIFKKYADQSFSYTDCTSFALMREKKIREAFAFDKDFQIFGFQLIPNLHP